MPQAGEHKVERRRLMERFWGHAYRWRVWIGAAILAAAAWVLRPVLLALATQIFWAYLGGVAAFIGAHVHSAV